MQVITKRNIGNQLAYFMMFHVYYCIYNKVQIFILLRLIYFCKKLGVIWNIKILGC